MGSGVSKHRERRQNDRSTPTEKNSSTKEPERSVTQKTLDDLSRLLEEQKERRIEREESEKKLEEQEQLKVENDKKRISELQSALKKRKEEIEKNKVNERESRIEKEEEERKQNEESKNVFQGTSDPDFEQKRISALRDIYGKSTKPISSEYRRIIRIAKQHFQTQSVFISLMDRFTQWVKAQEGKEVPEQMSRNLSFCQYTVKREKPFIVLNFLESEEFKNHPAVQGEPYVRFYAGAPILTPEGMSLGSFCLIDYEPHEKFNKDDQQVLTDFAQTVYRQMELERSATAQQKERIRQTKINEFSDKALSFSNVQDVIELGIVTAAENLDLELFIYLTPEISNEYSSHDEFFGPNKAFNVRSILGWGDDITKRKIEKEFIDLSRYCLQESNLGKNYIIINPPGEESRFNLPNENELGITLGSGIAVPIFEKENMPHGLLLGFTGKQRSIFSEEQSFMISLSRTFSSVIERTIWTIELQNERKRSEDLLLNVLPRPISLRLKAKEKPIADGYQLSTILFADLVGFTQFSSQVSPKDLVGFLNEVFSAFDRLISDRFNLEKVKTIGDAYMCAGGLLSHEDDHPETMVNAAHEMFRIFRKITESKFPQMEMRIGVNTGPIVAGVIGTHKFLYDLWGDAVNVASRMESSGVPGKIQISEMTYALINSKKFNIEESREVDVKGKGQMHTYILGVD